MDMSLDHLKERLAYLDIELSKSSNPACAIVTIPASELKSLFEFAIAAIQRDQIRKEGFGFFDKLTLPTDWLCDVCKLSYAEIQQCNREGCTNPLAEASKLTKLQRMRKTHD